MNAIDWSSLPLLLTPDDLAVIYRRKKGGVLKALQQRSAKLPTPCQNRPYRVRKADCKRHFEKLAC